MLWQKRRNSRPDHGGAWSTVILFPSWIRRGCPFWTQKVDQKKSASMNLLRPTIPAPPVGATWNCALRNSLPIKSAYPARTPTPCGKQYMQAKGPVLSPSTRRVYGIYQRKYFDDLADTKLRDLTNEEVQVWITRISAGHAPKTVRNIYGLLTAVVDMYAPHIRLKVKLPDKIKPNLYVPSDEDVKALLDHVEGTELEVAILLAAFGPLRRGEICALTDQDIRGNTISVNKAMVLNAENEWVIKTPKTYSSNREIEFPPFVIAKIPKTDGRIIQANPTQITNRFRRALKFSHLPNTFRFHDLRHYAASIMHAIGIPDQYIMQRGGWATDSVMKTVYRGTIDDQSRKMTERILQHFEDIKKE